MSHHSTPALALAAALALTGVSVPALAASPQPGGGLVEGRAVGNAS